MRRTIKWLPIYLDLRALLLVVSCNCVCFDKNFKMTTKEYQYETTAEGFAFTSGVTSITFVIGTLALSAVIALSGWIKSKKTGIFTTSIGFLVLLFILITMLNV